jgi:hypothetical protein
MDWGPGDSSRGAALEPLECQMFEATGQVVKADEKL